MKPSEPANREWPTVPRDHTKYWIPTNQRRQKLDPNQSDRWNSKGPSELATLRYITVSLMKPEQNARSLHKQTESDDKLLSGC